MRAPWADAEMHQKRSSSLKRERTLHPLQRICRQAIEQYAIEATVLLAMFHQVMPRRHDDALLLCRAYACSGAAEPRVCSQAHLDKHQRVAILRNDVDLAAAY